MKRFLLPLCFLASAWAVAEAPLAFNFEGPRIFGSDFSLSSGPLTWYFGGGFETVDLGREAKTGLPLGASQPSVGEWVANGMTEVRYTYDAGELLLWVGAGVLAHGDLGMGSPAVSYSLDHKGGVLGFGRLGLTRNRLVTNDHRLKTGSFANFVLETGPKVLSVRGTDYWKAALATSWFVPLWDLEGAQQTSWGELGFRANAQWIDGTAVPILLLEEREVRGYYRILDTKFRSVATAEFRTGLPSLWGPANLVPVLLAFVEGGWYYGYSDAPASVSGRSGWLASTGAGLGLNVFGFTTLTLTAAVPLLEDSGFWWKFNFNVRF